MFERNLPSASGCSGQEELCRKIASVIEVWVDKRTEWMVSQWRW
jgi:hypothetical protein